MPLPGTSQAGLAESCLLSENSVMGRGWGWGVGEEGAGNGSRHGPRTPGLSPNSTITSPTAMRACACPICVWAVLDKHVCCPAMGLLGQRACASATF